MTGADTPAPAIAAPEGKWGITYDYYGNCTVDACLTSMYWNWGVEYARSLKLPAKAPGRVAGNTSMPIPVV